MLKFTDDLKQLKESEIVDQVVLDYYMKVREKISHFYLNLIDFFGEDKVDYNIVNFTYEQCKNAIDKICPNITQLSDIDLLSLYPKDSYSLESSFTIYFPKTTVTDDKNVSIVIKDTYIRLYFTTIAFSFKHFKLIRTNFTAEQWNARYMHSHTARLSSSTDIPVFSNCCIGNGPISRTIRSLQTTTLERIIPELITLFCFELTQWLETESTSGGPYIRLSSVQELRIGFPTTYTKFYQYFPERAIPDINLIESNILIQQIWDKRLIPVYYNGISYVINDDYFTKIIKDITQEAIQLKILNGLYKHIVINPDNTITYFDTDTNYTRNYPTSGQTKVLQFKDKDIMLIIEELETEGTELGLDFIQISYIIQVILMHLNSFSMYQSLIESRDQLFPNSLIPSSNAKCPFSKRIAYFPLVNN